MQDHESTGTATDGESTMELATKARCALLAAAALLAIAAAPTATKADDLTVAQETQQTPLQKCRHECGRQAIGKSKNCVVH